MKQSKTLFSWILASPRNPSFAANTQKWLMLRWMSTSKPTPRPSSISWNANRVSLNCVKPSSRAVLTAKNSRSKGCDLLGLRWQLKNLNQDCRRRNLKWTKSRRFLFSSPAVLAITKLWVWNGSRKARRRRSFQGQIKFTRRMITFRIWRL